MGKRYTELGCREVPQPCLTAVSGLCLKSHFFPVVTKRLPLLVLVHAAALHCMMWQNSHPITLPPTGILPSFGVGPRRGGLPQAGTQQ